VPETLGAFGGLVTIFGSRIGYQSRQNTSCLSLPERVNYAGNILKFLPLLFTGESAVYKATT
jgi:hypothetical protein